MREIKFRAWRKDLKEMFYSDFVVKFTGSVCWWTPEHGYDTLMGGDKVTVMQYTGLKDKNGKEIYEGDVLQCVTTNQHGTFKHVARVTPNDKYQGSGDYDEETIVGGWEVNTTHSDPIEKMEVIGNIYENPELIEK